MFDACVLGVDPGLANVGLAVVARRGRSRVLVWADTVRTGADEDEAVRLCRIADAVTVAVGTHRPDAIGIERVAWNRNQVSALRVARATGAIMAAGAAAGVGIQEYGPNEVKIAVTGIGNADKRQVRDALVRIHGLRQVPTQPDAADAVAVALTHLLAARSRAVEAAAR